MSFGPRGDRHSATQPFGTQAISGYRRVCIEDEDGDIRRRYSAEILDQFGAPELSKLSVCGAKELPEPPDYLSSAMWNYILGVFHPDVSVRRLDLAFLRRMNAAYEDYGLGREGLLRYIEGVESAEHRLGKYLSALTHFEQCIGSVWQAAELFNRMEQRVLRKNPRKLTLYTPGEESDLERINKLNNVSKHFQRGTGRREFDPGLDN